VTSVVIRRSAIIPLAFGLIGACSKDSPHASPSGGTSVAAVQKAYDSVAGAIDLGRTSYSATNLGAVGAVTGTIRFPDAAPPDSTADTATKAPVVASAAAPVAAASSDSSAADSTASNLGSYDGGASAIPVACDVKPGGRKTIAKKTLANTIVWVANVKTGKAMPVEKRAELSSDDCLLDPRVQAVTVGTTINVVNDDKMLHRLVFTKLGTHDTLTVTPFFNAGQMVASERLAKTTGIVEVRCVQHPLTRAYIAVFDHPYFAVTGNNGAFKIDSLPPGTYKMMVWREGAAKPVEQQIQIAAGGTAKVDLMLK
jgi:hypothetical protein